MLLQVIRLGMVSLGLLVKLILGFERYRKNAGRLIYLIGPRNHEKEVSRLKN